MPGLDIGKAPSNSVVLPFYAAGALAFLVLATLLFLSAFPLLGGYFNPHILAIVHTAALGWGTMVIFGASYQLLPVICENDLWHEGVAKVSFYFLTVGATCLVICFWSFITGFWMILGGSLVFVAALLFSCNVLKTASGGKPPNIQKLFIASSSIWLLLTVSIGILLAINLRWSYIPGNHLHFLTLHAHAGLAGWFLQLIVGVSAKLVPMFLLGRSKKDSLLKTAFVFQNAGLVLLLLDGFFSGPGWRYLIYGLFIVIGIVFWLLYLRDIYRNRIKKPLDFSMKHTFLSFFSLLIAIAFVPLVYFGNSQKWAMLYGLFIFVGWISSLILGMTFKTLPFIVWNGKYKMLNGKAKIPLPRQLYRHKLLSMQFWIFVAGLYVMALSLIFDAGLPLQIGLGLMLLTALIYAFNILKVLTHRTVILG
ncbi:MAG TPA: hypothetical protein VFL76_00320 [Edaphocola sp.]|nr:hypothetical protein [Edaphocola sp.]